MKINRMLALALAACGGLFAQGAAAPAQPEDTMKGVVQKKLAPVSKEILRVKLPRAQEAKLKNGLPVLVLSSKRTPVVTIDLLLPATSLMDPEGVPGVAAATASMMTEGTIKYTSRQIADKLAALGASLSVGGGGGGGRGGPRGGGGGGGGMEIHLTASALSDNLDELLELVSEVLLRPTFPEDELKRWKAQQRVSLMQRRSTPEFLGSERLQQVLYGGDARALNLTPESLEKITRQQLVDFHKAYFRPGNSLLGVAGDVEATAIVQKLEKAIGAWEGGNAQKPDLPLRPPLPERKIYLVDRPNSVQTVLTVANRAIGRRDPDFIACAVMNRVLGQGPAARLFRNIREEKGYTYGVSNSFNATMYLNAFSASSSVRNDVTAPALTEFLNEFRTIREKPVPAEELDGAKRAIVAGFALSLESANGVLGLWMQARQYGLPADYWDTYTDKVMAVNAAEVQRVATKYVPLDNVQVIAVGDAAKIGEALAKFGPVEKYDSEGKKLQ